MSVGLKIVFFGTPSIAGEILKYLLDNQVEVLAVVTKQDKPLGRKKELIPPPVKVLAKERGIAVYQPVKASDPEFVSFLKTLHADLFVVAAFSEILKENLLEVSRLGCINVHASLLPKFRGAAPIQRCIMAGEKESGVTIMMMDKGLDTGGMLTVVKTSIYPDMNAGELAEQLIIIGSKALLHVIQNFEAYTPIAQKNEESTYAKKLSLEDAEIMWDAPADQIYNQIRGVSPKPGAWCIVEVHGERKRLKLKKARLSSLQGIPGKIVGKPLIVACQSGAIEILEVQLEGKKELPSELFMRGTDNIKF